MFKRYLTVLLWLAAIVGIFSKDKENLPRIVIMDIMSNTIELSDTKMFTDVLRTELYKLGYFNIVERGVIQQNLNKSGLSGLKEIEDSSLLSLGKQMDVEKLLICTMNSFESTTVLNIRIIDVESSYLDYTENIYLKDRNQIFEALQELVLKIELYYIEKFKNGDPISEREKLFKTWVRLGSSDDIADKLTNIKSSPSNYLEMRQYDILFTPLDYYNVVKTDYDLQVLKTFFMEGISYHQIKKAFSLGIIDLENYKNNFKTENYTFSEYMDAYEHNILTPYDYEEYQKGFKKFQFIVGIGGVANDLPIANADTKFFLLQGGAEYFITDYQRGLSKVSTEMGIYLLNVINPSPYFQVNSYFGKFPFYMKASAGCLAEVFIGGHFGAFGKIGFEVNNLYEFNIMTVFAGTQPTVSYTDFSTKQSEEGYVGIKFPYMAATFAYKF